MKCPVCQHEMTQSQTGWLCLNCGHFESFKPEAPAGSDPVPAAVDSVSAPSQVDPEPQPNPEPQPDDAPASMAETVEIPGLSKATEAQASREPFTPKTHPRPVHPALGVATVLILAVVGLAFL